MTIKELIVRVKADTAQLIKALEETQQELKATTDAAGKTGDAIDGMAKKAETAAKRAKAAQEAYRRELELTFAKIEELSGRDDLATARVKFAGFVSDEDLALLSEAKKEIKSLNDQRVKGERETAEAIRKRQEVQQKADSSALSALDREQARQREINQELANNIKRRQLAQESAENAYRRELDLTKAKIAEVNGTDGLATLRQKFGGLIGDGQLAELKAVQAEYTTINEERVAGERAVEAAQRETDAEAAAAARRREADIKKQQLLQEKFNLELAKTAREYEVTARNPIANFFNRDKMPDLRLQHPGIPDSELQKMANLQTRATGIEAGRDLLSSAGTGAANVSAGIVGIGLAAANMSREVEHSFTTLRNNTTLTDAQFKEMKASVLQLAQFTGSNIEKLAEGYQHIANFGYQGADAMKLLTEANKAARATGGDVAITGQLLAKIMKENGIATGDAAKTMNMLWYAAANSDARLSQLIETGGRVFAMASKMGLGFKETSAVMSTFMASGLNAANATEQLQTLLTKIVQPSSQVRRELEALSKQTGINLVKDFSISGLQAKQFSGIMADVRKAAELTHQPYERLAVDLFPNLRGTIGALIGTSNSGVEGLTKRLHDLTEIEHGASPINARFAEEQKTTQAELDKLTQTLKVQFLPVGKQFADLLVQGIPIVRDFAGIIKTLMGWFLGLPKPMQEVVIGFGAIRLATIALGNPLPGLIGLVGKLVDVWKGVQVAAEGATAAEAAAAGAGGKGLLARLGVGVSGLGAAATSVLGIGALTVTGLVASQTAAGNGGDRNAPYDVEARIQSFTKALEEAKAKLRKWEALGPEGRLQKTVNEYGTDFFGKPNVGRDQYGAGLRASIGGLQHSIDELKPALQHERSLSGITGDINGVAPSMIQQMAQAIHTPEGQASCGYFASALLHALGEKVPAGIGGATELKNKILSSGGKRVPLGQAQAGDYVYYTGPQYGTSRDGNGNGHHAAVYLGNGMIADSTGNGPGHQRVRGFSDAGHAEVFRPNFSALTHPDLTSELGGGEGGAGNTPGGWYDKMRYDLLHPGAHKKPKLTPEQKEQNAYNAELASSQAKLNELMQGGDHAAESLAGKYRLLTQAARDKLTHIKEEISTRETQRAAEGKFKEVLNQTNAAIKESRANEEEGLAKLKKQYPGVSEERLKYLLNQKEALKTEKEEHELQDKLQTKLSALQSQLNSSTDQHGKHKVAVELTGKAYESLTPKVRGLIDQITVGITKQEQFDALAKLNERFSNAQEKVDLLGRPKSDRDVIGSVGGVKVWDSLKPEQQAQARTKFNDATALEKEADATDKARIALEKLHEEMVAGSAANKALLLGDGEEAAWETRLTQNEGLRKAMAEGGDAAKKARSEFHDFYTEHERAQQIKAAGEALKSFNAEMEQSIKSLNLAKAGNSDTAEGGFAALLGRNRDLAAKFGNDPAAEAEAFAKFKQEFELSKQVAALDNFRRAIADTRKETQILLAPDDFSRFKAQNLSTDKDGNLKQVLSDGQLKQVFDAQQKLQNVKQFADGLHGIISNMFTNLAQGGHNFFGTLVSGFEKMFQDIAVNYVSSQFYNLVVGGLGQLFGAGGGGGGGNGGFGFGSLGGTPGIAPTFGGGKATGGSIAGGKAYLVGEHGPELLLSRGPGTIVPHDQIGGGDTHYHTHANMTVVTQDAHSFQRNESQIYGSLTRNLRLEQARNSS